MTVPTSESPVAKALGQTGTAPATQKLKMQKPQALKPGDTIAIISPAAPSLPEAGKPDPFEKGLELIEQAGFKAKLMPNARKANRYLAGTDKERVSDLMAAFQDPSVSAILCSRGGYGCMRLLSSIDFEVIAQNPKVFIGFSDVTSLLLPFYQRCGLVGFYGPMLTSNLIHDEPESLADMLRLVTGNATFPYEVPNLDPYVSYNSGVVEAPLIGGNLSLLTSLCGTPYQPETAGHLLFIEDWKEKRYQLDRQFRQLKLAGLLDDIVGLILADFSDIENDSNEELSDFFKALLQDLDVRVPAGYGFSIGHGDQTGTLPMGVQARFDAAKGQLTLLESPVLKHA